MEVEPLTLTLPESSSQPEGGSVSVFSVGLVLECFAAAGGQQADAEHEGEHYGESLFHLSIFSFNRNSSFLCKKRVHVWGQLPLTANKLPVKCKMEKPPNVKSL